MFEVYWQGHYYASVCTDLSSTLALEKLNEGCGPYPWELDRGTGECKHGNHHYFFTRQWHRGE